VEAGLFDAAATRACLDSGLAPRCLRLMLEPRGDSLGQALRSVGEMEAVLEDSYELPDGTTAQGNTEIVAEAVRRIAGVRAGA
jgi:hypothetical protein